MDSLLQLPDGCIQHVLQQLDARSLVALQQTCTYFSRREPSTRLPLVEHVARAQVQQLCSSLQDAARFRWALQIDHIIHATPLAPWAVRPSRPRGARCPPTRIGELVPPAALLVPHACAYGHAPASLAPCRRPPPATELERVPCLCWGTRKLLPRCVCFHLHRCSLWGVCVCV